MGNLLHLQGMMNNLPTSCKICAPIILMGGGKILHSLAKNSIYLINTKPFVPEFQEQKAFVYSDLKLFPEITHNTIQDGKVNLH